MRVGALIAVGVLVIAMALAASLTGCGSGGSSSAPGLLAIEDRGGGVGGVAIGSDKAAVRRALGSYGRDPQAYPIEPLEVDEQRGSGGPWSVLSGPHYLGPGGLGGEQVTLRYRGVSFFVRDDRVFGFMVTAPRTPTTENIGVGDLLERVRDRYPSFVCEGASRSDTSATQEPACFGRVGARARHVYFGGDPIQSITVMERAFEQYRH